jgi:hypothetical protein
VGGEVLQQFWKPTGDPSDPRRDKILGCQRIQQRILANTASAIMGADSDGDEGLSLSVDLDE